MKSAEIFLGSLGTRTALFFAGPTFFVGFFFEESADLAGLPLFFGPGFRAESIDPDLLTGLPFFLGFGSEAGSTDPALLAGLPLFLGSEGGSFGLTASLVRVLGEALLVGGDSVSW